MIYSDLDVRTGDPIVLTIPGLGGSGPGHWQSLWEETRGDCERAELGMWSSPRRDDWTTRLGQAISASRPPVVLVAHSLGCLALAWWAAQEPQAYGWPVVGALLVAPPDVERADACPELADFAPFPRLNLPFPSILVTSSNDPYASIQRSHDMAKFWGSHFVDAGPAGHLNADSGLGAWQFGQTLLDGLIFHGQGGVPRPGALVQADWDKVLAGEGSSVPPAGVAMA